jgi:hypothetical protein
MSGRRGLVMAAGYDHAVAGFLDLGYLLVLRHLINDDDWRKNGGKIDLVFPLFLTF